MPTRYDLAIFQKFPADLMYKEHAGEDDKFC